MGYRHDLWEVAAEHHGVITVSVAEDAGVPAVEVRKLAHRGALRSLGQGVYVHCDVPSTDLTQPTTATALAGNQSFLHRESVLDILQLGQFNPHRVLVATRRRVRRNLPEWMDLEYRTDVPDDDLTHLEGIPATTARRALMDVRERMPPERWTTLVEQALRSNLVDSRDFPELGRKALSG